MVKKQPGSDNLDTPEWHLAILAEREQRVAEGKSPFTDWE